MTLTRVAIAVAALAASAPAVAATPAFERALLAELDATTRAEVERRATGGNTVTGVVGTILLNNYQAAGPRNAGESVEVVAVDFGRGAAVIRRAPNVFEVVRFDPRTLRVQR